MEARLHEKHDETSCGTCARCGGERETAHRWCRRCKSANMRERRARGVESIKNTPRANIRAAAAIKLRRWNLRPVFCMVCGRRTRERVELHHPVYDGPDASWLVVLIHPGCRRRVRSGAVSMPEPIDLHDYRDGLTGLCTLFEPRVWPPDTEDLQRQWEQSVAN